MDTGDLLVDMTRTIKRTCRHVARHEKGIQAPAETLERASGSCRDLAVLMIAALRSLGFAARFVSGYLRVADDDDSLAGGNTHAWVQVYLPGPGWVDFDPSSGASATATWCGSRRFTIRRRQSRSRDPTSARRTITSR